MKKVIGIVLAALFLTTGIAAATDFTLSGSYYARGQYYDNVGGLGVGAGAATNEQVFSATAPTDTATVTYTPIAAGWYNKNTAATAADRDGAESYGVWDHELSVDATWQIDDSTKVFARFEMRDENWGAMGGKSENSNVGSGNDDNIVVERVWGSHKFAATGGTLTVGLMGGGAWGTSFFNNAYDAYRVKYVQPSAIGTLIAIYQKALERGSSANADDGDVDVDLYMAALVTKAGPVTLMPLVVFVDHEIYDANTTVFQLAATGDFGAVSFEAEADYQTYDSDYGAQSDADVYGFYAKGSFNAGAATISLLGAYGSYDDDEGVAFCFGDDFEAGGALIIGDDMELVPNLAGGGNDAGDLGAGYLVAALVSFAATDELTIDGYIGYWAADSDYAEATWGGADDADVVEISGGVAYKITANLTYSIRAGWADLDIDGYDLEDSINAYHKLAFSF